MIRQSCLLIADLSHLLLHRCTVVFAAHDANTYSDQIFRSLRLDQNGAMLLEVVALTRNERDTLEENVARLIVDRSGAPISNVNL